MPTVEFTTNLLYYAGGDRAKEAELDALGRYDSLKFLVEAKGADVTDPARRGAPTVCDTTRGGHCELACTGCTSEDVPLSGV